MLVATTSSPEIYLSELEATLREFKVQAARDAALIAELMQRIHQLEEQFRLAQLKRYAPSSEKQGVQSCLFNEAELAEHTEPECDEAPADLEPASNSPLPPKKRGRKKLAAYLPRVRVEHDIAQTEKICACCQGVLHKMGEEVSEQLHIVPAKVQVLQHVRFKYACRYCAQNAPSSPVITSPMPAQPMPGSIASASTIAMILTAKYADGIPLYRMQSVLERSGVELSRGTMGRWTIRVSEEWFSRIYEAMRQTLLRQDLLHGDETGVQVLKEAGRRAQSTSYMWVYRSAADCPEPVVLFDYQPGRGHAYPQRFLEGFAGTLMSDGYTAWRMLPDIHHLGCFAHVRRYFMDALKAQKHPAGRAKQALDFIGALYKVEKEARSSDPSNGNWAEYTYQLRQTKSRPVLDAFHHWLVKNEAEVLPKSLIGKAIRYALGQWKYVIRYIEDGHAPIDNNLLERDIRPFTIGRKNWIFSDTVAGARASAIVYSLMLSCRACNIEPYRYLCHLLTELPQRQPGDDITDLLPFNFQKLNAPSRPDTADAF